MTDPAPAKEIWPTYAMRAWLGAIQTQTQRTQRDLEDRIEAAEREVARLRRQHARAGTVVDSLQEAINKVDLRLRQVRDIDPPEHNTAGGGAGTRRASAGAAPKGKEPDATPHSRGSVRDS